LPWWRILSLNWPRLALLKPKDLPFTKDGDLDVIKRVVLLNLSLFLDFEVGDGVVFVLFGH